MTNAELDGWPELSGSCDGANLATTHCPRYLLSRGLETRPIPPQLEALLFTPFPEANSIASPWHYCLLISKGGIVDCWYIGTTTAHCRLDFEEV